MITLFQESVPFSNNRLDEKISKDGKYSNPVMMSYAFDTTIDSNIFETVVYLRNDDQSKYYKNVVIALMKENEGTPSIISGQVNINPLSLKLPGSAIAVGIDNAFEDFTYLSNILMQNTYMSTYHPVDNDGKVEVKLSYGYDEISNYNWENKKSAIIIPYVGTVNIPDMSYIPIRVRIKLLEEPNIVTLRDYFIDISYESEISVAG